MCDTMQTPTQQATQQATQQVADSDVSSELNSSSGGGENGESKPWARLFPVGVAFHAVGKLHMLLVGLSIFNCCAVL